MWVGTLSFVQWQIYPINNLKFFHLAPVADSPLEMSSLNFRVAPTDAE